MRLFEIGIVVVLVAGMFLVLAFGFNTTDAPNVDNVAIATPATGDCATMSDCGSGCGGCDSEPVLTAALDFSGNNEYALDTGKLVVNGNSVNVYSGDALVGKFNLDASGKIVPVGSQPNGNVVKSAYSGPPGDTRSTYRVYPASFNQDSSTKPYMAIDFAGGTASVTPGTNVAKNYAKSDLGNGVGYGGSVSGATGGGCGTSGGGGGG